MSRVLTVEMSESAYAALESRARVAAQSPAELAATALEQLSWVLPTASMSTMRHATEAEKQAARRRFERHFGAVNLGYATGVDNETIDADLARAYANEHEGN